MIDLFRPVSVLTYLPPSGHPPQQKILETEFQPAPRADVRSTCFHEAAHLALTQHLGLKPIEVNLSYCKDERCPCGGMVGNVLFDVPSGCDPRKIVAVALVGALGPTLIPDGRVSHIDGLYDDWRVARVWSFGCPHGIFEGFELAARLLQELAPRIRSYGNMFFDMMTGSRDGMIKLLPEDLRRDCDRRLR
jgi:hypothetical protein